MTPEERELRRALDARSGEPSPQFHARLTAALDEGKPASGLMQAVAMFAVIAITLGTVGALVMSRNARNVAHQGVASGSRLASPAASPTMVPQDSVVLPSGAKLIAPSHHVVWALVDRRLLFLSTDGGSSWEKRSLPLRDVLNPAITFFDERLGWVLAPSAAETQCSGAGAEIWRTDDGGSTWQSIALAPGTQPQRAAGGMAYSQCNEAIYFVDPNRGFVTAWDDNHRPTIYRTADGGSTWSASTLPDPPDFKSSPGGFTLRPSVLKRVGSNLYLLASGMQEGVSKAYVFRSTDGGFTWEWMTKIPSMYIAMVTESRWLQLIVPGQSMETTNSGQQWHQYISDFSTDTPVGGPQVVFADSTVGYAEGRGALQRTVDGGIHWERITTPGTYMPNPAPSPTPLEVGPLPDPKLLTGQNCSKQAPTTETKAVGPHHYTVRPVSGWSDTGDYSHTESLLLELSAPFSYGRVPTRLQFHILPYDVNLDFGPHPTAHSIAADEAATHKHLFSPRLTATAVADCLVAGEPAAVFGYAEGKDRGYWLLFIHHNSLMGIRLFGSGGIDDKAIQDALRMIGSIVWTS